MEIQKASSYDYVEVLFLVRQCVKDMNNNGLKQWNNSNPSPGQIKQDIESGLLYLYKELGIVKGMIRFSDEGPKEYKEIAWKSNTGKVLYIRRFAVHPLWQYSDIGEKLLEFAEIYAKQNNYNCMRLDVYDSYPIDEKFFVSKEYLMAGVFQSTFQKKTFACFEKSL